VNSAAPELGGFTDEVLTLPHESDLDIPVNYWVTGQYNRSVLFLQEQLVQWVVDDKLAARSVDASLTIEPNLAESWEVSDDGRSVTFHLREGVKWSDGEPFTADDILFTWNDVLMSDEINSQNIALIRGRFSEGGDMAAAGGVPELEKIDDYTFVVNMQNPFPEIVTLVFRPTRDIPHPAAETSDGAVGRCGRALCGRTGTLWHN
jgi:ABC-type transport system substrate-binding protein